LAIGGDSCESATTPTLLTARDRAVAIVAAVLATSCLAGDRDREMCGINGNDDSGSEGRAPIVVVVFVVVTVACNRDDRAVAVVNLTTF